MGVQINLGCFHANNNIARKESFKGTERRSAGNDGVAAAHAKRSPAELSVIRPYARALSTAAAPPSFTPTVFIAAGSVCHRVSRRTFKCLGIEQQKQCFVSLSDAIKKVGGRKKESNSSSNS